MKKTLCLFVGLLISASVITAFMPAPINEEEVAIKSLIEKSYFNGAFNGLDTKSMGEGFHPDFAIFSVGKKDSIDKYPIHEWIENIEKRKAKPNFDPTKREWLGEIKTLDVTGKSAIAKIELRRNGKLTYTDYLSLLKFGSGWKIVGKVFSAH